jgi:hypothetical protein
LKRPALSLNHCQNDSMDFENMFRLSLLATGPFRSNYRQFGSNPRIWVMSELPTNRSELIRERRKGGYDGANGMRGGTLCVLSLRLRCCVAQ